MKRTIALAVAIFCTLLFSIQISAQLVQTQLTPTQPTSTQPTSTQPTPTQPTPTQPTLNWEPVAGEFIIQDTAQQNFPPPLARAASQSTPKYPATIRVRHHPQNACRNVSVNQIDTIPFEEYVARVLPSEVPATWELATLQAQAIAIRTYAWRQILAARPNYDVSDWIDFQNMCDDRHPATDAAVIATAGQYLSAISDQSHLPIVAMYSAENGHPTLTNSNVDYLQAVPDLYSLGRERFGHGYGLSQWGAQRRARAGQTYTDILGHYYTNTYLSNALKSEEITAHLIGLLNGDLLNGNGIRWQSLLSTNHAVLPTIAVARSGQSDIISVTAAAGVWQPIQPVQHQEIITLSLQISNTEYARRSVQFDTLPPPAPRIIITSAISAASLPITLSTPISGLIGIGQQWIWPGERFTRTATGWRSPPTTALPAGQSYRALVSLRLASAPTETAQGALARLEISDLDFSSSLGKVILGVRDVWASSLAITSTVIAVDFHLFDPSRGLTLDLAASNDADIIVERMQILRLPEIVAAGESNMDLPLYAASGETVLYAAAFDDAGNVSQIVSQTVQINDVEPPIIGTIAQPLWHTSLPLTISVPLTDILSGLDLQSGSLIITATDNTVVGAGALAVNFTQPENPWTAQAANVMIPAIDDGRYTMRFASTDAAGNGEQTKLTPLQIDTINPTVELTLSAATVDWHRAPVSVTLAATDTTSGIDAVAFTLNGGTTQRYANPVAIGSAGRNRIRAWANDIAGNQSPVVEATIGIDLAAPILQYTARALGPSMIEVTWQAADDMSGVDTIMLQKQIENRWVTAALSAADLSASAITIATENSRELRIRMRVTDNAGRSSAWVQQTVTLPASWHYFPLIMGR